MKRLLTHGRMVVLVLAALLCAAGTVWADSPHFLVTGAAGDSLDATPDPASLGPVMIPIP